MSSSSSAKSLESLLAALKPNLISSTYVFVTLSSKELSKSKDEPPLLLYTDPQSKSTTALITLSQAKSQKLKYTAPYNLISLQNVPPTLSVTAAPTVAGATTPLQAANDRLRDAEIPCHTIPSMGVDAVLVPADKADDAVNELRELARESKLLANPDVRISRGEWGMALQNFFGLKKGEADAEDSERE